MAGISLAHRLIKEKKNRGKVIASGKTVNGENYLILKLEGDKGRLHQIDYGSDIRIDPSLNLDDIVELKLLDDYCAKWVKVTEV